MKPRSKRIAHSARAALVASVTLVCGWCTPSVLAQALAPGWEALPEETIACIRMPNTAAFVEQVRQDTKLGQVVFTEERIEGFKQIIQEENEAEYQEFVDELERYGFTVADLIEMAQQPWGAAMVSEPRDGDVPRLIALMWADLDDEQIDRIFEAQERAMEEEADAEFPPTRTDLELAGQEVRQLMMPETDWFEDDQENWNEHAVDQTQVLMTRLPGRLVLGIGIPQVQGDASQLIDAGQTPDFAELVDAESTQAVFARFLEAQTEGEGAAFAATVLAPAEAAAAVPQRNDSAFEFYADGEALFGLLREMIAQDSPSDAQEFDQVMSGLGFDGLGVMAGSYFLEGEALLARMWAEVPEPRRGLFAVLDQETLPAAPPDWVAPDLDYAHVAYDLSAFYDVIVEMTVQIGGDEAMTQIQMANGFVGMQVQNDIPSILRALGTSHRVALLPNRTLDIEGESTDIRPFAVVWEVGDVEVWERVMNALVGLSAMGGPGVQVESVEEQGFRGLRSEFMPGFPASLMLGTNKLVLGVGPDVTPRVLSLLNNPPAAGERLADSELAEQAEAVLGDRLQPGWFYQLESSGRQLVAAKKEFMNLFRDEFDDDLLDRIEALMPTDDELRDSLGATVNVVRMTDTGLVIDGGSYLPAP